MIDQRLFEIIVDSFGKILLPGLTMTIPLTAISFFFALIIALIVAMIQFAHVRVLRQVARFYVWVIRGTPLLVQLFIIFYGLPSVGIMLDAFPAAVIAFAFNEGAYCAETMRGALESVPQGQLEAGYCVGMTWWQIMRRIVLPQAMRIIIPPTGNETIGMLKTTALVTAVPFTLELQFATNAIANRIYKPIPLLLVACFWYLLITSILMVVQSRLEAHFGKGFNARPVGTKGKQPPYDPPYPGKSDGEPKDDVNKINQTTFAGLNA